MEIVIQSISIIKQIVERGRMLLCVFRMKEGFGKIWKEDDEEIVEVLEEYFGSIFQLEFLSKEVLNAATMFIDAKLSQEDMEIIQCHFTEEEIIQSLETNGTNQSSRPRRVSCHLLSEILAYCRTTSETSLSRGTQ